MLKRLLLVVLSLIVVTAHAQFTPGQILTAAQLNSALSAKFPISGGTLTGPLTVPSLSVTGAPIPLASGGTGAASQSAALANLLGSSAVPIANGGTGAATATAATANLLYLQGATGSVARPLPGKLGDVVSVFDFMTATQIADAKTGTPTIDAAASIQAAINAVNAAGGGTVNLPPYRLKVLSQIIGYSGVSLKGSPGLSILDTSARMSYQNNELQPLLMYKGTKGTAIALTADATYGATTITVASTTGLSVGQEVEVTANSTGGFSDSSVNVQQAELFLISSLTSTQIALNRAVVDTTGYTVANGAVVAPITPVSNVEISGIELIGLGRDVSLPGDYGIGVFYGQNVRIDNNIVSRADQRAIYVVSCYNCDITRNKVLFDLQGTNTNENYGIEYASASIFVRIRDNYAVNMRHGVVSSHLSMAYTEKYPGINRAIDVSGNSVLNAWLTGIATHSDVEYLTVRNNYVTGGVNGINLRERNAYAIDNTVFNCSGIGLYLSANPQKQVWQGNKVIGCPTGLSTGSITTGFNMVDLEIRANQIYGANSGGIALVDTVNTGPFRNVNVVGNTVAEAPSGAGTTSAGINLNGAFSGVVSGNVMYNLTNLTGISLGATTQYVRLNWNDSLNTTRAFNVTAGATGIVGMGNYYKGYTSGFIGSSNLATSANNTDGGSAAY